MTNEEKQLLLRDLCARLPYGVFIKDRNRSVPVKCDFNCHPDLDGLENIKLYLRPMKSMTEEEFKEWHDVIRPMYDGKPYESEGADIDFFNKYHFDYRRLIDKGLALEAPEGMYNK